MKIIRFGISVTFLKWCRWKVAELKVEPQLPISSQPDIPLLLSPIMEMVY
jgi:hypothetical protein